MAVSLKEGLTKATLFIETTHGIGSGIFFLAVKLM
jgi:hypothetical protein